MSTPTHLPLTPLRIGDQFKTAFSGRSLRSTELPPGLLSQAIENLKNATQRLLSLAQILPEEAQTQEVSAIHALQGELNEVSKQQEHFRHAVTQIRNQLDEAEDLLDQAKKAQADDTAKQRYQNEAMHAIGQATADATALKQRIDATNQHITRTRKQIIDLSISLAPIRGKLMGKQIGLDTELQTKKQQIESEHNNLEWASRNIRFSANVLLAVEQKFNDLEAQASRLRAQLADLAMLQQALETMIADFSDVVSKLTNVSIAVLFVASYDSNVITDLQHTRGDQLIARAYLQTAIRQLQTIQVDVA